MAAACRGVYSQDLATILDPFRVIFVDLGPDRRISAVETGQMSAVDTGQMSAVEIGQMSAVEPRHFAPTPTRGWAKPRGAAGEGGGEGKCLVSIANIFHV